MFNCPQWPISLVGLLELLASTFELSFNSANTGSSFDSLLPETYIEQLKNTYFTVIPYYFRPIQKIRPIRFSSIDLTHSFVPLTSV